MIVKLCVSAVEPTETHIISSKGDRWYVVTKPTLFNDPVCECPGYLHRGHCRHIDEVVEMQCKWRDLGKDATYCPDCLGQVVEFELEPEIE